jgi:hypothetical protein
MNGSAGNDEKCLSQFQSREWHLFPILKLLHLPRLRNKILKYLPLKVKFIIYVSVYKENCIFISDFLSRTSAWAPRNGFNQWHWVGNFRGWDSPVWPLTGCFSVSVCSSKTDMLRRRKRKRKDCTWRLIRIFQSGLNIGHIWHNAVTSKFNTSGLPSVILPLPPPSLHSVLRLSLQFTYEPAGRPRGSASSSDIDTEVQNNLTTWQLQITLLFPIFISLDPSTLNLPFWNYLHFSVSL